MESSVHALESILEHLAPNDVLMPVARDTKHPLYPHKGGRWTRGKFQEFTASAAAAGRPYTFDVCVLLQSLCVIDVDTRELCVELELRFPLLTSVASEITKRGKHYWFRRSQLADDEGFFDGAAQVEPHIDFKTLTSSGTSGVVVVAPSRGKSWSIPLSAETLIEIPEDLLRTVAIGQGPLRLLSFLDSAELTITASTFTLARMSYFEPFLDVDEPITGTIPVPCDSADFEGLLQVLRDDGIAVGGQKIDVDAVIELADKLGLVDVDNFATRIIARAMYDADMDPDMCSAMRSDELTRAIPDDGISFVGEAAVPLGCFLFGPEPRFDVGQTVVEPPSSFESRVDPRVVSLLQRHPLVLAGGAALSALSPSMQPGADYDLFVHGVDESGADAMLESIHDEFREDWKWIRTSRACTFVSLTQPSIIVQVILRIYDTPQQVPASFDLAPCKICAWYSSTNELRVEASPEFFVAMQQGAFPVDVRLWNRASVGRIIKYCAKGMDVYLPGLRRSRISSSKKETLLGVLGLLRAEQALGREHRPQLGAIASVLHMNATKSGYDEDTLKLSSRLYWVVNHLIRKGVQFFASQFFSHSTSDTPNIVLWHRSNMTVTWPAALENVHDEAYVLLTGFNGLSTGRLQIGTLNRHDALIAQASCEEGFDKDVVSEELVSSNLRQSKDVESSVEEEVGRTLNEIRLSMHLLVTAQVRLGVVRAKRVASRMGGGSLQTGLRLIAGAGDEEVGRLLIEDVINGHQTRHIACCLPRISKHHKLQDKQLLQRKEAALKIYVETRDVKACINALSATR